MGANEKLGAAMHGATPLDDIKRRLAAATPGPWECDGFADGDYYNLDIYKGTNQGKAIAANIQHHGDADFFMNARQDMARLIAALEAVKDIKDQNFFDTEVDAGYSYGWNAALEEINAAINSHLGES